MANYQERVKLSRALQSRIDSRGYEISLCEAELTTLKQVVWLTDSSVAKDEVAELKLIIKLLADDQKLDRKLAALMHTRIL